MGFRFRVHRRDLPGNPDIVLPRHGKVIFVHGCFWHGHKRCPRSKRPTTNICFWNRKLDTNIERDKLFRRKLRSMGWKVLVIWQCETRRPENLLGKLERFLHDQ
jgi:DNA mismatch endonuclease (patch repair protein)